MYVFFGLMDVYTYVPQSATDVADADVVVGKIDDGESSVGFVRSCALGFVVVVVVVVPGLVRAAVRLVSSRCGVHIVVTNHHTAWFVTRMDDAW